MSEHPSDDTLESLGAEDTWEQERVTMSEQKLSEKMKRIALDLPDSDDLTNREYWLRTEILEWADRVEAFEDALQEMAVAYPPNQRGS